jgi:hypothetical protein
VTLAILPVGRTQPPHGIRLHGRTTATCARKDFRIFSRLPDPVSRVYANILDAATNPFHIINYYGSCAAALVDNRRRMGAKLEDE